MSGGALRRAAPILAALAAAWLMRSMLGYVLSILSGGGLIALLMGPACRRLEQRMPRGAAIVCLWLMVLAAGAALLAALAPVVWRQVRQVGELWPQWCALLRQRLPQAAAAQWTAAELTGVLQPFFGAFHQVTVGVAQVVDWGSRLGMMAIVSVFLLLQRERYELQAELLVPCAYRRAVVAVASQIGRELSLFLRGQLLVGLCVGGLSALGLFLVGLDNALLLGVLVGALNLIPYFGPILGAAPVLLSAWGGGWTQVLLSALVLVGVQQLDGLWISPGIMSAVTGLSPLAVLLSMAVGGSALGILGMLLAVPAAIALRIIVREAVLSRQKRGG